MIYLPTPVVINDPAQYLSSLTLGPSQLLEIVVFSFACDPADTAQLGNVTVQLAKLDRSGNPVWDQTELVYPHGTWSFASCRGVRIKRGPFTGLQPPAPTLTSCIGFFVDDPIPIAT